MLTSAQARQQRRRRCGFRSIGRTDSQVGRSIGPAAAIGQRYYLVGTGVFRRARRERIMGPLMACPLAQDLVQADDHKQGNGRENDDV